MFPMAVKWRVDELVERRGWSARELAERAGLDVKTVRAIMTGRATRVDLETIGRLADALGVSPGDLWRQSTRLGLADRWKAIAGSGGRATTEEMDWVLGRTGDEFPESGLERATRDT
jgi:DNA-binding Xre family transcriptional regulator